MHAARARLEIAFLRALAVLLRLMNGPGRGATLYGRNIMTKYLLDFRDAQISMESWAQLIICRQEI